MPCSIYPARTRRSVPRRRRRIGPPRRLLTLAIWPISGFLLTLLVTSMWNVARNPECLGLRTFLSHLVFRANDPVNCSSVAFLVDTPTLILSFTGPFAAAAFLSVRDRLSTLEIDLTRTGLLAESVPTIIANLRESPKVVSKWWLHLIIALLSLAMVSWLYSRNIQSGGIFETLASPNYTRDELAAKWWANYRNNPWLAALCILIGSIGVHFSIMSVFLYGRLTKMLIYKTNVPNESFAYVPKFLDSSHGWNPLLSIAALIYFTALNFAFSMVAVYDMLNGGPVNQAVAGFFIVLGVLVNLSVSVAFYSFVRHEHQNVWVRVDREAKHVWTSLNSEAPRKRFRRQPVLGPREHRLGILMSDLSTWTAIPFSARRLGPLKLLFPGIAVLLQLASTLSGG